MVDFNIDIKADAANARKTLQTVDTALKKLEGTADRTRTMISLVAAGLGAAGGISEIIELSDTYTRLQNRIRVVTDSQKELEDATTALYAVSQDTRSSFESTTELYSRLSIASKELGRSQEETIQFTKSMNQAIIASGATALEANGGLIQLSQGISSNALAGAELRSVLEQLPVVADVIAKELGITRGQLRAFGADGKITGEIVLDAFKNAREEIEELYSKTVPTLQQSFVVLKNSLIRTFGQLDQGIGATASLSSVIMDLARNMEFLARAAISASVAIMINLVSLAIPRAIVAIGNLTMAIARNPFGALAIAITIVVGALVGFSDQITLSVDSVANLRDVFSAFVTESGIALSGLITIFSTTFTGMSEKFRETMDYLNIGLEGWLIVVARTADDVVQSFFNLYHAIITLWNNFPATIKKIFATAFNGVMSTVESALRTISSKIIDSGLGSFFGLDPGSNFSIDLPRLEVKEGLSIKELATTVRDAFVFDFDFDPAEQFANRVIARAKDIAQARIDAAAKITDAENVTKKSVIAHTDARKKLTVTFAQIVSDLKLEAELLKMSSADREIQNSLLSIESTLKRELTGVESKYATELLLTNQLLGNQSELFEDITSPVTEYKSQLVSLNKLVKEGTINQLEYNTALANTGLSQSFTNLKVDLGVEGADIDVLKNELADRQLLIQQAQTAGISSKKQTFDLLLAAEKKYKEDVANLDSELAQSLTDVKVDIGIEGMDIELLQTELAERQSIIQASRDANIISKQEHLDLLLAADKKYNQDVADIESARMSLQLSTASNMFSSLTQIASGFVDDQSTTYKALFAISKGFAIADATVQIAGALSKAANNVWPANLAAMATVAASTASIVSTIQSTDISGFKNGGNFKVGGSGGTDSQLVQFKASPNETVSVKTPGQEQQASQQQSQAQPEIKLNNINVLDPTIVEDFLTSAQGEQVLVNSIQRNSSQVSELLRRV